MPWQCSKKFKDVEKIWLIKAVSVNYILKTRQNNCVRSIMKLKIFCKIIKCTLLHLPTFVIVKRC